MTEEQRLKRNAYMREWYAKKTKDPAFRKKDSRLKLEWYYKNHDKGTMIARKRRYRMKAEMFEAYGGKCNCCGEDSFEFLTLDHVNEDGSLHRATIGKSMTQLYQWFKQDGKSIDIRVLCYNCHWSITFQKFCPHADSKSHNELMHIIS